MYTAAKQVRYSLLGHLVAPMDASIRGIRGRRETAAVGRGHEALVVVAPREKRSLRTDFRDGLAEGAVGGRRTRGAGAAIDFWVGAASLLLQDASIRAGKIQKPLLRGGGRQPRRDI